MSSSSQVVRVEAAAAVPGLGLAEPIALDMRLRAIRKRRWDSRLSSAAGFAIWIAVLATVISIVGGGLLGSH
jgi:hypothetical protein